MSLEHFFYSFFMEKSVQGSPENQSSLLMRTTFLIFRPTNNRLIYWGLGWAMSPRSKSPLGNRTKVEESTPATQQMQQGNHQAIQSGRGGIKVTCISTQVCLNVSLLTSSSFGISELQMSLRFKYYTRALRTYQNALPDSYVQIGWNVWAQGILLH